MKLSGKFVFIVEDNVHNRAIYQMIMVRNGARVEFDRWGRNTLSDMKKLHKIDVIILDLMLPSGDSGYDIYQKIRQQLEYRDIPIVAISAADPTAAIPKAKAMGFSGFIAKPINDDILPDQLTRIIAGEEIWYTGSQYESAG